MEESILFQKLVVSFGTYYFPLKPLIALLSLDNFKFQELHYKTVRTPHLAF